jgi:hypothetical protein
MAYFDQDNSIEEFVPQRQALGRRLEPHFGEREDFQQPERRQEQSKQVAPDAVAERHNLYVAEERSTRIYYVDYQQKSEVMRATKDRVATKYEDAKTVAVMLDLAQERGWNTVKVKGSESFMREAWVQASVRGLNVEGYRPQATDQQELQRRQASNQTAAPSPAPAPETRQNKSSPKSKSKESAWANATPAVVNGRAVAASASVAHMVQ